MGIGLRRISGIFTVLIALFFNSLQAQEPDTIPTIKWTAVPDKDLPPSVDNSILRYFPPIIDQIGGSCAQASSIGYMFTYEMNRLLDRDASDPANRFSYLYVWNFINGGKNVGSIGTEGLNLALANGIITEKDFPDQKNWYSFYWASGFEKYLEAARYRVRNFQYLKVDSPEGIRLAKQYLYNKNETGKAGGILTFSSTAGGWTFDRHYDGPSATGYTCLLTKLSPDGPHAMTIVGYDDLIEFDAPDGRRHKGAFIVANSHGRTSQDRGRFYLPYWFFLNDGEGTLQHKEVTGTTVEYREPGILFRIGLDYTSRDDLSFRIGVSGNSYDTAPLHDYIVPIANNQGGDFNMQGNSAPSEIEFGFDFSSHINRVEEMKDPNYFLTIVRSSRGSGFGEGEMISFSVYDYRTDPEHPVIYDCRNIAGRKILKGENIFSIPTGKVPTCSCSPAAWLNTSGEPAARPFIFRTADGKYAKARMSGYDREKGRITIKYVYAPDGSRKLK